MSDIERELQNKKIALADIDGFGITLWFDDGTRFEYDATDGGCSTYELIGGDNE